MTEQERIAKRLSEGQRRAIKVMSGEFKVPPRGHAYWAGTMLYGDRLTEFRHVTWDSRQRMYRLTELGLAVRQHLENTDG